MGKRRPARSDIEKFRDFIRGMEERQQQELREATEFRPGELTPEEEKFVGEKGLNALNYIPRRTLEKQREAFDSRRMPVTRGLMEEIRDRIDGYGYVLFVPMILFFALAIISSHGWAIGIFCGVLMFAVLELSYRLSTKR
jgi:hypothetical protein